MYKNEFRDAKETKKILENGSPDIFFKVYHKINKGQRKHVSKSKKESMTLTKLAEEMRAGFEQVNARIDRIEVRLDNVEKRLDYNNLKDLPKNK